MPRRSGVTLLEVLVAIFVMGIGMLALLTLFPLGALRMAKAIQDEKCAQAGANAQAMSVIMNVRNDPGLFSYAPAPDPFLNPLPGTLPNANPDGPSYPVLIDPIGWMNCLGLINPQPAFPVGSGFQVLVAGGGAPPIAPVARRSVSFVSNAATNQLQRQAYYQWFTLLDDIDFENALPTAGANSIAGTPRWLVPVPPNPAAFTRDIRYSYAFLCQRPRYADATVVDTSVVVYNKRMTAGIGNVSLPEFAYNATFNTASNTVTMSYGGNVPPPLRSGDWILDATFAPNGNFGSAHGYFYRVVAVNDVGGDQTEVEVETPLRGFPLPNGSFTGTVVVLDGVAEVFQKGPARLP